MQHSILFLGSFPSHDETIPSARVLRAQMRAAGLEPDDYEMLNVFSTPGEYDDFKRVKADEETTEKELARLGAEIRQRAPTVIVPLGAIALWALFGTNQIGSYRGTPVISTRTAEGIKLLPTFHPEDIRKQWKFYSVGVADLMRAEKEAIKGPGITYPKRTLLLSPTVSEVESFLADCQKSPLLSVDIETGWGQITSIGFAPTPEVAMCVPFVDKRKPNRSYWPTDTQELRVMKAVREVLEHPVPKLGQNFQYDLQWIAEKWGINVRNYAEDTRLLHHALYAELPKDLEFMGSSYSDQGAWKTWGGGYSKEKRDA